jgi:DNA-binding transcriptional ArsR family regulator
MPLEESPDASESGGIKVRPSATLELMWVLHNGTAEHVLGGPMAQLEGIRLELGPEIKAFWSDGVRNYADVVVLSERAGTLFDLDLDGFFSRMDQAAQTTADGATLLSESSDERVAMLARLQRLRADPGVRRAYRSLLHKVWESVRPEWESTGRRVVTEAAADWARRLNEGVSYRELLVRHRLLDGHPDLDEMADAAAAAGRLVISPGWYFGKIHAVELDGIVYLGRWVRPKDEDATRRQVAVKVAGRLKVLADPTRLGILLWLARGPASVTEIAGHFNLSQPTISAHVQLLREAGLIEEKPVGRSAMLSANEQGLRSLFDGAEESLLKLFLKPTAAARD